MKFVKRKILVGVSGGAHSMYLLYKLSHSFFFQPIALHVNYHFREDSDKDQEIVKNYCQRHRIDFYSLDVDKNILDKFSNYKNLEAMAREIRYSYFEKMAKVLKTNILYIGHHKDDFLETAILQDERSKDYLFYGLKKINKHHNLIIKRPLLKKTKIQIILYCQKHSIPFAIDLTNLDTKYQRNKIRQNLLGLSLKQKNKLFDYFKKINLSKEGLRKKVYKIYSNWNNVNFDVDFFKVQEEKIKINLIYEFLSRSNEEININLNKIKSLISFINANHYQKFFELSDLIILKIENKKLVLRKI